MKPVFKNILSIPTFLISLPIGIVIGITGTTIGTFEELKLAIKQKPIPHDINIDPIVQKPIEKRYSKLTNILVIILAFPLFLLLSIIQGPIKIYSRITK